MKYKAYRICIYEVWKEKIVDTNQNEKDGKRLLELISTGYEIISAVAFGTPQVSGIVYMLRKIKEEDNV